MLVLRGRVVHRVKEDGRRRPLITPAGGKPLRFDFARFLLRRALSRKQWADKELVFFVWPRTDKEGKLEPKRSIVAHFLEPERASGETGPFALGRLAQVDRDEGFFRIEILPNPEGKLQRPFPLTLWAGLELLDRLPQVGAGVRIRGDLRVPSLRLVALEAEEVLLPPTREAQR